MAAVQCSATMGGRPILLLPFYSSKEKRGKRRNGTEGRIGSMGVHVHISLHYDIKTTVNYILLSPEALDDRFAILTWIRCIFNSLNMVVVCVYVVCMYDLGLIGNNLSEIAIFLKSTVTEITKVIHFLGMILKMCSCIVFIYTFGSPSVSLLLNVQPVSAKLFINR